MKLGVFLEHFCTMSAWKQNPLWTSWATSLDKTDIWYVLPEEYHILCKATQLLPAYSTWTKDNVTLYILGKLSTASITQSDFWCEQMPTDTSLSKWAKYVHHQKIEDPVTRQKWEIAYKSAWDYFLTHRKLVRLVGRLLGTDMENHDLTKTTLFHYALAYLWHWDGPQDSAMKELAWAVVREQHLSREDHHPEFSGTVDFSKLVTDRLAVHLQKDTKNDGMRGWGIDAWIPEQGKEQFSFMKKQHGHKDLYTTLAKCDIQLPSILD